MAKLFSMDQVFIKKLTDILEVNIEDEHFGVKELTKKLGTSRSKLHRKLHAFKGKSASQFIREYRLKKAMVLLQNSLGTASEIAYRVGFGSPTYFNTCFHEYYGYPPGEAKHRLVITTNQVDVSSTPTNLSKKRTSLQKIVLAFFLGFLVMLAISYFNYTVAKDNFTLKKTDVGSKDKSIAMLPCKNLSVEKENQFFADGVMGSTLIHLNRIAELKVISGTTMEKYRESKMTAPEIGKEVGVSYLLEASAQKYGDSIKIIVHLIDANADEHVWSQEFKKRYEHIFTIQSDIAEIIAEKLKATITNQE